MRAIEQELVDAAFKVYKNDWMLAVDFLFEVSKIDIEEGLNKIVNRLNYSEYHIALRDGDISALNKYNKM